MNVKIVSFTFSLNFKGKEVYFNHAGYGRSGSNLQVMSLNNCNDRRSNNGERAICSETQGVGSGLKRTQAIEMTILRHFKGFYLSVDCFQGSEIDIISIRLETAINFC